MHKAICTHTPIYIFVKQKMAESLHKILSQLERQTIRKTCLNRFCFSHKMLTAIHHKLPICSLSTLLQLNFFLLGLNNNSLKYTTPLSLQPTPLATLALLLTNTLLLGPNHYTENWSS